MGLKLISPPALEPLSIADLKAWCKVDVTDEDALLTGIIIPAARKQCEALLQRPLINQTWDQTLDAFPSAEIELRKAPVSSIVSVKYFDVAGAEQTLSSVNYTLDSSTFPGGWLLPAYGVAWPSTRDQANAVTVRYVCGFGPAASDVPETLRMWMAMVAAFVFANRESMVIGTKVVEIPSRFVESLLDEHMVLKA